MTKVYKYQQLMDEKGVKQPCPFHNCEEKEQIAYHFGFTTIEDKGNFIPGHKKNSRINAPDDIVNCAYCSLSMYKTKDSVKSKWNEELPKRIRSLLKYTHLLEGALKKEHGVMSIEKGNHFSFFEYEGVELKEHFKVVDEL